jgi:beta-glucosidase-like glycosyl hydrolase
MNGARSFLGFSRTALEYLYAPQAFADSAITPLAKSASRTATVMMMLRGGSSALTWDGWKRPDYLPFTALKHDGMELVMLSNAAYPALDSARRPAAMSRQIVQVELRRVVGFDGVTISDSLATPAIQRTRDPYVKVARAGTDILLFASEKESVVAFTRLVAATRSGSLSREQTRRATARILALKTSLLGG